VNQLTWFHRSWRFLTIHTTTNSYRFPLPASVPPNSEVGPNGKLISGEQLRLIYILLQGHLEGKEGDGVTQVQQAGYAPHGFQSNVLAMGSFTKFPVIIFISLSEITKITQMSSPFVALTKRH
jgi:hypothetical protein